MREGFEIQPVRRPAIVEPGHREVPCDHAIAHEENDPKGLRRHPGADIKEAESPKNEQAAECEQLVTELHWGKRGRFINAPKGLAMPDLPKIHVPPAIQPRHSLSGALPPPLHLPLSIHPEFRDQRSEVAEVIRRIALTRSHETYGTRGTRRIAAAPDLSPMTRARAFTSSTSPHRRLCKDSSPHRLTNVRIAAAFAAMRKPFFREEPG